MTHRNPQRTCAILSAALALGIATAPALAASGSGSGSGSEQADKVTQAELRKFADAYGDIRSVRAEYASRLRNADDKAQQQQLKKEGQQEMVAAIEDAGLEVAEYRRIGQRLSGDKELQARLQTLVRAQQQSRSSEDGSTQTQ